MMTFLLSSLDLILAQATQPVGPRPTTQPVPWWAQLLSSGMFPLVVGLLILYFFIFRSKKKQDNDRQKLLDSVKKGDTIETIGGLYGTVVSADEKTVVIKADETANVKLKFNRRAIHRVVSED